MEIPTKSLLPVSPFLLSIHPDSFFLSLHRTRPSLLLWTSGICLIDGPTSSVS